MTARPDACQNPPTRSAKSMPPKRKTLSSATAPKPKKEKKPPAPDWRQPVFYWRGAVTGAVWEGTWVASTDGLPSDADFKDSANTFRLECGKPLSTLAKARGEDRAAAFAGGTYKLDNGEGLGDYSDLEHKIFAFNGPPPHHPSCSSWAVVGACGDTEFGRFVSLGRLDEKASGEVPGDDTYGRLTLARRYLAEDDPRAAMSAYDVARRVASCGADEWANDAPWLALPWKVPTVGWPGPQMPPKGAMKLLEAHCEDEGTSWAVGFGPRCS